MPLRGQSYPPNDRFRPWRGVLGGWPMVIVQGLNQILPDHLIAEPRIHLGFSRWESGMGLAGEIAQTAWSPPGPSLAVATEAPSLDEYAVRIYDMETGRKLVAAVEIVSPANKDRPEHRRAFVNKCDVMLREEVSVTIVDIVTSRSACLYDELLEQLGQRVSAEAEDGAAHAASVRWRPAGKKWKLESWAHRLNVGDRLPTLPLWLAEDLAVPLDLESSYEQTCRNLRIP